MSGRPSQKSAEIGLFRPFSAFFALFRRVRRAPGKSRKRRKKAFFLRYPRIALNPHLLNPHLRHPKSGYEKTSFGLIFRRVGHAVVANGIQGLLNREKRERRPFEGKIFQTTTCPVHHTLHFLENPDLLR